MKFKNWSLMIFLASAVYLVCTSFGIKPDTTLFHINGFQFGLNIHHNWLIKVIGIISFSVFITLHLKDKE